MLFAGSALAAPSPQVPYAGSKIPQFKQPLPKLSVQPGGTMNTIVADSTSFASPLQLSMCEFQANILPPGTFVKGQQPATWVSPNDGTGGAVGDSHGYLWHCHIIDHEDNEMMRPDVILPNAAATRSYVKGVNF